MTLAAGAVLAGGCAFDAAGVAHSGDAGVAPADGFRDLQLHQDQQSDTPADAPAGAEARPPDLSPHDAPLDALEPDVKPLPDLTPWPDLKPWPDLTSPCVSDHFTTDIPTWAASVHKGSWSWLKPTHAHRQLPSSGYAIGELLIKGSQTMLSKTVQGTATLTLKKLYNNGNSHGAGFALLIKQTSSGSTSDRLVTCVAKENSSSGNARVAIWYFAGGSNSASALGQGSASWATILNKPVKLTMTLVPSGATSFTMTCAIDVDGKTSSVSKDISSYVSQAPFGVGLVTFGTTVSFDAFSLCP
jgi:hypothetical protein